MRQSSHDTRFFIIESILRYFNILVTLDQSPSYTRSPAAWKNFCQTQSLCAKLHGRVMNDVKVGGCVVSSLLFLLMMKDVLYSTLLQTYSRTTHITQSTVPVHYLETSDIRQTSGLSTEGDKI
jgi:hypothetical protein